MSNDGFYYCLALWDQAIRRSNIMECQFNASKERKSIEWGPAILVQEFVFDTNQYQWNQQVYDIGLPANVKNHIQLGCSQLQWSCIYQEKLVTLL